MVKVTPFRRWHLSWLMLEEPVGGGLTVDVDVMMSLEKQNSWTVAVDGLPICCGGTIKQWEGRHQAWMYMTKLTAPHMLAVTRAVRKHLDGVPGRVEMTVREDFKQGHRWAQMLGFEREALFRQYGPEGEDHVSYIRLGAR